MDIPHKNSIQERQSIIAQATARGLQLSEDGKSWVPINRETNNIPYDDNNVIIVKNGSLISNEVTTILTWIYFFTFAIVGSIVFLFVWFLKSW